MTSEPSSCKLSVILPTFNEAEKISRTLNNLESVLDRVKGGYQIIVVDDGSVDGTTDRARRSNHNSHVEFVGYKQNYGKGYALNYGFRFAKGDHVVFLDSDTEIGSEYLLRYVKLLETADFVIASKRHPESKVTTPAMRRFLSYCFAAFVKIVTDIKISDTQTGLKACRSSALRKVLPLLSVRKYAYDVELLTVAQLYKMKIIEMPVTIELQGAFKPSAVVRMFVDLLGIGYRLRVKKWYQANMDRPDAKYDPIIKW